MERRTQKLTDVATFFEDGNWIESKDQAPKGFWLVQTGNIGIISFRNKEIKRFVSEETFKRLNCTEIFSGDILISRLPDPVGRACIVPQVPYRMLTAVDCSILRLKKDYDARYINYLLNSNASKSQVYQMVTGSSRKRISRTNLGKIELSIPFKNGKPDIAEQKYIADKLDKVFAEIEKGKKYTLYAMHKEAQFKLSFLKEIFGDKHFGKINLEDITTRMKAGGTPNTAIKNYWGGKIPFVKISDITASEKYLEHTALTITQDGVDNSSTWIVPEGSLILSMYGTVGKVVINKMPVAITQNMAGIIPNKEKILPEYLYYALNFVETNVLKDFLKTSVHKHFGIGEANKIPIPVPYKNSAPDLTEQQHIVDTLNKAFSGAEKLSNLFERQAGLFVVLRSSVLNQSFQMQI